MWGKPRGLMNSSWKWLPPYSYFTPLSVSSKATLASWDEVKDVQVSLMPSPEDLLTQRLHQSPFVSLFDSIHCKTLRFWTSGKSNRDENVLSDHASQKKSAGTMHWFLNFLECNTKTEEAAANIDGQKRWSSNVFSRMTSAKRSLLDSPQENRNTHSHNQEQHSSRESAMQKASDTLGMPAPKLNSSFEKNIMKPSTQTFSTSKLHQLAQLAFTRPFSSNRYRRHTKSKLCFTANPWRPVY